MKAIVLVCLLFVLSAVAKHGVLELDDITFDKIVDGSKDVVVQFVEYAWKDSHIYEAVGDEFAKRNDLFVTKVATKDNSVLKERFHVEKEPFLLFFHKSAIEHPVQFHGENKAEDIISFINAELSPQMTELKNLAGRFLYTPSASLVSDAEHLVQQLHSSHQEFGKAFLATLRKIQDKGNEWIDKERSRLQNLISSKSTVPAKQAEFKQKLSVFDFFVMERPKATS